MYTSVVKCALLGMLHLLLLFTDKAFARLVTTRSATSERDALLELKANIVDPGRSRVAIWKERGEPCFPKPWPHITCSSGRVESIDLGNLDISGVLPTNLGDLRKLKKLHLDGNQFTGTIPQEWASRRAFSSLEELNLSDNFLDGQLPNRIWNVKNAFRSLRRLVLSGNQFSGGLPDGWLSSSSTFKSLTLLDLSDNDLGRKIDGSASTQTSDWCLAGRTPDSGWCPQRPLQRHASNWEILDLSGNGLEGALPVQWGAMFPSLRFLFLHYNNLHASSARGAVPSPLPAAWTSRITPQHFPQLESLVLYPGNDNICSLPDLGGTFQDINTDRTFHVEDDDAREYDEDNPWFCPGSLTNNPPTDVAVLAGDSNMLVTWTIPADTAGQTMDSVVYAYRLTVCEVDVDTEECVPVSRLTARVVLAHGDALPPAPTPSSDVGVTGGVYTLQTGLPTWLPATYRVRVSTLNMDLGISESVYAASLAPPTQVQLAGTPGNPLTLTWAAAYPNTGVDEYVYTIDVRVDGEWVSQPGYTDVTRASAPGSPLPTLPVMQPGGQYRAVVQARSAATGFRSAAGVHVLTVPGK